MGNTHFLKAFSGSDFELADFLNQQVIDQLPDTQKSFLAAAALLDKFCPELLDFALGNSDSEDDIKEVFIAASLSTKPTDIATGIVFTRFSESIY